MSNGTSFSAFYDSGAATGAPTTAFNPGPAPAVTAPAPRPEPAPAPSPAKVVAQWQRIVGTVSHEVATTPADKLKARAKSQPKRLDFAQYLQTLPEDQRAAAIAKREADLADRAARANARKGRSHFAVAAKRFI